MSAPQPASGAETERAGRGGRSRAAEGSPFKVAFEHGRWRHAGWTVLLGGLGGFLILRLGAVGKVVGVVLVIFGVVNLVRFARTLLRPAGTVEVREDEVVLPEGLCRKKTFSVPFAGIRHAFFLRRAVPWTRTGPILVIETEKGVFSYPRDWFATDADQRRIAMAINRRLGRL